MNLNLKIVFLFLIILFISCDEKRFFDDYQSVDGAWHKDSIITFDVDIKEANKKYNLFVNIRANNDYKFKNLFLIIGIQNNKGLIKVDTLQYEMANPDGTLLGEGFSEVKESKLFYKEKYKFDQSGNYKIHIQQAVRKTGNEKGETKLNGIQAVGFRIESIE